MTSSLYMVANTVTMSGSILGPLKTRYIRVVAPSISEAIRIAAERLGTEDGEWSARVAGSAEGPVGIVNAYEFQAAA
jgi:hypothetical protein